MKIFLYLADKIEVFYLPKDISGSYSFDSDNNEDTKLINVEARENRWVLYATDDISIIEGTTFVTESPLLNNKFYVIRRNEINYLIYVTNSYEKELSTYTYNNDLNITVGIDNSTLSYQCEYIKDIKLRIMINNGQLLLQKASGYIYINKIAVTSTNAYLKNGDEVEFCGVKLIFINNLLIVIAANNVLSINGPAAGLSAYYISNPEQLENKEIKDRNLYSENEYFSKSPRIRRIIEEKDIELSSPPSQAAEQEMPIILTIGPMLTMGISSVVMLGTTIHGIYIGDTTIEKSLGSLITSGAMLLSMLLWPILMKIYNKKQKEKRKKELKEKYELYLKEKKIELENERKLQKEILIENLITLDTCLNNIQTKTINFWDKRIDQNDFLVARLGVGNELLKVKVNYPKEGFSIEENELKNQVDAMREEFKYIENVPIGYSFYENKITAIMGENEKSHYFVNNILLQLLSFYSYDDVKIALFTNKENEKYWDYLKYLNHTKTNDDAFRFFSSNQESANNVAEVLMQEINNRLSQLQENNGQSSLYRPYYLIIIDDLDMVKRQEFLKILTEVKANIGFSLIILEKRLSKLPSLCNNFISIGDKTSGVLKNSYEKQEQVTFYDEINYRIDMMNIAKMLANTPIEISTGSMSELPDAITFLEMAKVGKVEQLNIMNRWNTNDSKTNLKAEVGVDPDGELMYLDLHEKAHGPHGLIAGMTGSGKSEFIITWILSLAMNFSPEDVAFILIDYKGGGLAFAFENQATGVRLPHLTGTITNLDKAEIDRTLVSIDSEVKRRQRLFNEARDKLGESTIDIYKYQGFFHEKKLDEPLPHLFIVCDEFAELKSQQPDFMDNLISVARIGRSLGVHLVLATQKPSGVVNDQIWSNTKFRVCLKVQDASDSNEMLKKPDAASLKQTGRFYLQVGYDEYFALGQSGWCGAKYYPSDIIKKETDKSVSIINECGITIKTIQAGKTQKVEAQGEQLAAIMKEIIKVAKESNKYAQRLWLENIPEKITIAGTIEKYNFKFQPFSFDVVIGEYDAPEKQEQSPLIYNFLNDGNANFVSTDTQETETLLNAIIYNSLNNYAPEEVSFYIVDYGSQNLVKYNKAPHCGGVVSPGETEKYNNLFKLLREEQKERKKILAEFGGEYVDYLKQNPKSMPLMVVILNNYESIYESNQTLYDTFGELLRDSERYGIVYIITSSSINSIPGRFKQLIPFALGLKLKDPSDYQSLFNVRKKIVPRNMFGRGICLNDELHEFQTVLICEDRANETKEILDCINNLNEKKLTKVKKIPTLPEQVLLEDVEKRLKSLKKIPIGIEKSTLNIKTMDLTVSSGSLILTLKMKNTTSFVKSFIDELNYLKKDIILIDPLEILTTKKEQVGAYINDNYEEMLDKIIDSINKKTELNAENETIVIFNSLSKFLEKITDKKKMENLFEACKKAEKGFVVVIDEFTKLKDLMFENWYKNINTSDGIYLGPGVADQTILKISNYSKELTMTYPKNQAFYISEGAYSIVKVIEFEREVEQENDEE